LRLDETTRREDAKEGHYVRANRDAAFLLLLLSMLENTRVCTSGVDAVAVYSVKKKEQEEKSLLVEAAHCR
jgi:hypothetical protein